MPRISQEEFNEMEAESQMIETYTADLENSPVDSTTPLLIGAAILIFYTVFKRGIK